MGLKHIPEVVALVYLITLANAYLPNCEPNNQFLNYCFSIDACSSSKQTGCEFNDCGYYENEVTSFVKIRDTEIIPRCAFGDSPGLVHIYGVNSKIRVLSVGSFSNLPDLQNIHLAFNLISEIHRGIFKNVSATMLDLSWNKIIYMEKGALEGLYNLRYLNLSRNELLTIPMNNISPSVEQLIMSYNFVKRIILNSRVFKNLTSIDASYNVIENIAVSFDYPIAKLDLTHNLLNKFDFIDVLLVEDLKIPLNYFMLVPEYLAKLNAKKIELYPNPWLCDQLENVWKLLRQNAVQLVKGESDKPICVKRSTSGNFSPEEVYEQLKQTAIKNYRTICENDNDCPDNMACRAKKCWDPCKENLCDESSVCVTEKHRFKCTCPEGSKRNPLDLYSKCQNVECYISAQCDLTQFCKDFKCETCDTCSASFGGKDPTPKRPTTSNTGQPWWFDEIPVLKSPVRE